jgi:hypothetical protein
MTKESVIVDKSEEKEPTGKEGIKVPEEFQQEVYELISMCENREQTDYIRTCLNKKEDEMRKAEMTSKGKKTPSEYSSGDMPLSD